MQKKTFAKVSNIIKKYNVISIVMLLLAVFILSFIVGAQMNTVENTDIIKDGMRESELLTELQKSKEEYETLKEKFEDNEKIVNEYKTNASTNDTLTDVMKSDISQAKVLAGLTNVKGEGIVVTLSDSTDTTLTDDSGIVHDTYLTEVITELKAAGAEAISINGQRIIATTAIRCVGPTIQVNSEKVASPFYIKAIGDAKYLESALSIKDGVIDRLKAYGIEADVEINKNITIQKYDSSMYLRYAKEIK